MNEIEVPAASSPVDLPTKAAASVPLALQDKAEEENSVHVTLKQSSSLSNLNASQIKQETETDSPAFTDGSSRCGCLFWFTKKVPTNYDMLIFRTLNRDLGRPNANADDLAFALRDELMPGKSWAIKKLPWVKHQTLAALENPRFGVPGCINFIDARTQWFDSIVKEATTVKGIKQVVVLAAGFDTRAYRLAQPGVRFIEVDLPSASERKRALALKLGWLHTHTDTVSPAQLKTSPEFLAVDLAEEGPGGLAAALKKTQFDPSVPTLFTMEGLIYYLSIPAAHRLLRTLGQLSAPGSILQFDFMNLDCLKARGEGFPGFVTTAKAVANKGEPYRSGIQPSGEAVQRFVGTHGFRLRENGYLGPSEMVARFLPHLEISKDKPPPIASFYCYASVFKE